MAKCALTSCVEPAKFAVTTYGRTFKTGPFTVDLCGGHAKAADDKFRTADGSYRCDGDSEIYDVTIKEIEPHDRVYLKSTGAAMTVVSVEVKSEDPDRLAFDIVEKFKRLARRPVEIAEPIVAPWNDPPELT